MMQRVLQVVFNTISKRTNLLGLHYHSIQMESLFTYTHIATSVESFEQGTVAHSVYVIIAQSLVDKGPSFCLCL